MASALEKVIGVACLAVLIPALALLGWVLLWLIWHAGADMGAQAYVLLVELLHILTT